MANNRYKDFLSDMERKLNALRQFAMDRIFGGVRVSQLEQTHADCLNIRAEIQRAEAALIALRNHRDELDKSYDALMQRAVAGLIADPNFGPDCDATRPWATSARANANGRHRKPSRMREGKGIALYRS